MKLSNPFKKKAKMIDPSRFPKLIEPIEKEMEDIHIKGLNNMLVDLTKKMVDIGK